MRRGALLCRVARARRVGSPHHRRHHGHAHHGGAVGRRSRQGGAGDRCGARRDAPHRRDDEHLQADQRGFAGQRQSGRRPHAHQQGAVRPARHGARVLGDHRWRVRHHLRERRLHVRLPQARAAGRHADRQGAARRQLPPRDPRSGEPDRAVHAERRAHRSRRHRQGLLGGPRHRRVEGTRLHARLRRRGRRQPHHRRPLRQALDRRDTRSR